MEEEGQEQERQQTCLMEDFRIYLKRKEAGIVKEDKDGRRKQDGGSGKKVGKTKEEGFVSVPSVLSRVTATVSDGSFFLVPPPFIATFQTR